MVLLRIIVHLLQDGCVSVRVCVCDNQPANLSLHIHICVYMHTCTYTLVFTFGDRLDG